LYLFGFVFWGIRKKKFLFICYFLLSISLIISFIEYTYPFGPGTTQVIMWFLIGQSLSYEYGGYIK
jgi:hypothetical protein